MEYSKQNFVNGQVLAAEHLNHMEDAISQLSKEAHIETDDTLKLENGVLRVNTTNEVGDKTLPITAAAVHVTVGNIEVLLGTI